MQNSKFKTIISISILFGLISPVFSFAQDIPGEAAIPQTLGEAKDFAMSILSKLPDAVKNVWKEEALAIWNKMWQGFLKIWDSTIGPVVDSLWQKFLGFLGKKVEEQRPGLEKEFQKEKTELQKDLWARFKDLF